MKDLVAAAWRLNRPLPVAVALLLLANLGLFAWIAYGVSPRISELERRYIERQAFARQAGQQRERDLSPQERYRQTEADLQTFHLAIPPRSQFTDLIKELFTLAGEAGLNIERIAYDPKQMAEKGLLRYSLNFSVGGDYGQVKKFVHSLEQSRRIVAIEEISLSGGENPEGDGVRLNIRLSTYFHSDENEK